jgi:uncharacterized protein YndB with AHSA1/START domain
MPDETAKHTFSIAENISAPAESVWKHLTDSELVSSWMADDGELSITCDWHLGGRIQIEGMLSGEPFVNEGTITRFDPGVVLAYQYQNSISSAYYGYEKNDVVEFFLQPTDPATKVILTCETGYGDIEEKHLRLYWGATLRVLKAQIESRQRP